MLFRCYLENEQASRRKRFSHFEPHVHNGPISRRLNALGNGYVYTDRDSTNRPADFQVVSSELQGYSMVHSACSPTENALHPFSYAVCLTLNSEACECGPVVISFCRSLVLHEMYLSLLSLAASNF